MIRRSLVFLVAVALAACADPGQPAADPTALAWELESGTLDSAPIPIVDGHPITLSFTDDSVGGTAACNGYGGSYSISGDEIVFSGMGATEMACSPADVMTSELLYLQAVVRVEELSMKAETLTLTGEGVELVFSALPPVPTAELNGTVWVLEGLVQGDSVSSVGGDRATLELFTDGSMLGSTGCRTLTGRYVVTGAEVVLNELSAEGECPAELQQQDDLVVTVLGDGFRVAVVGDTLTLSSVGSEGLVYKADT
ncbi:MAG: META domain-containing protein [Acidimicrobiia bacterium]